jgi:hypothetical protein
MENEQLKFLKEQIEQRATSLNNSRLYYRKIAFWTYLSITILAALSTIILGLNIAELKDIPRIVVLIITGFITVISAYNTFFDNKEMWVANNNALNELYKLKFDLSFRERQKIDIDDNTVEEFRQQYQDIHNRLNKIWAEAKSK